MFFLHILILYHLLEEVIFTLYYLYTTTTVDCAYVINGEKLMAWDGLQRKEWCRDCSDCAGTEKDKDECFHDHQYPDILIYLCDEIGASTERNVCACMIDLARQNNLTLAELFKKYLG